MERIKHERDNRYCSGFRVESGYYRIGSSDDDIRLARHDLPGDRGITLVMPVGGIAFDNQVSSFDVTQSAQLAEESAPCAAATSFGKKGRRDCRMKNRYPMLR